MALLEKIKNLNSSVSEPINNALSNYDNKVEETDASKGSFSSKLSTIMNLASGKTSLRDLAGDLTEKISGQVSSFMTDKIKKLNVLANSILSKFGLSDELSKLQSFASKYLSNGIDLLNDLKNDALNQLKNASLNFVGNIVEDFETQLRSTIFIPDAVLKDALKSLYFSGADLAYNNHYIRKECLKRDLVETLKFVDKEYGISYNMSYSELKNDLNLCVTHSCYKNTIYIFENLYENYKEYKDLMNINKSRMEFIEKDYKDNNYMFNNKWIEYNNLYNIYSGEIDEIKNIFAKNFKYLLVHSASYLDVTAVREFFTKFGDILQPSLYSETGTYAITDSEINIMTPFYTTHDISATDQDYLTNVNNNQAALEALANNTEPDENENDENKTKSASEKLNDKINEFRNKSAKAMAQTNGTLGKNAITQGSNGVYTTNANLYRAKGQNSPKNVVKYRKNANIATGLENAFYNEDDYIEPKNKNIKYIYLWLSSSVFNGEKRLIHEKLYQRLKCKTMNSLREAGDKVKGIIGSSYIVQGLFDLSNAIDASGYKYMKKIEDGLFDPLNNVTLKRLANDTVSMVFDPDLGKVVTVRNNISDSFLDDETSAAIDEIENDERIKNAASADSNHGTNPSTINQLNSELDTNLESKYKTISAIRYISDLPMITKRDMIIKWLSKFYNTIKQRSYENYNIIFKDLCSYVFGKPGIDDSSKLLSVFEYSTNESLTNNCKVLISIINLNKSESVLGVSRYDFCIEIVSLFNTYMQLFARELSSTSFANTIFKYDREYLASHFKTLYYNELKYLKSIADKNNPLFSSFYPYKDKLTTIIKGFDRRGIFGYNDVDNRVQFTNIEIGDWSCGAKTIDGTFICGNNTSKNNGILILDEVNRKFVKTNITSGNWTSIFEYFETTFFVKDKKVLYYWNGSKIVPTNVNNFDDFECKTIQSLNLLMLCSKSNNGFKYWKNNKFYDGSTTGSDWFIKNIPDGYIVFPRGNAGITYIFGTDGSVHSTSLNNIVTDITYTTRIDNSILSSTDPETGESLSETIVSYSVFILIGTVASGLFEVSTQSHTQHYTYNASTAIKSSGLNIDGFVVPQYISDSNSNFITTEKDYSVSFQTLHILPTALTGLQVEYISKSEINSHIPINYCRIFDDRMYLVSTDETKVYIKPLNSIQFTEIAISPINIKTDRFFVFENKMYSKTNDNKGLYLYNDAGERISVLNGNNNDVTGWEFKKINNIIFLLNKENSKGIKIVNGNEIVDTNISEGTWDIAESGDYIYAVSVNGCNKGIRRSAKKTINFINFASNPITYGDFGVYLYDSEKKLIYFGQNRENMILNIDDITFDIDEFIFPLYYNQLNKLIAALNSAKNELMADTITEKLGLDDSGDGSGESGGSGDGSGSGGSSGDGSGSGSGGSGSGSGNDSSTSSLNDVINSLQSEISNMEKSAMDMEKTSNVYQDLLLYADAKDEFDIDDDNTYNSIMMDFIYNFDYGKFGLNYGNETKKYRNSLISSFAKTIIKHDYENVIDEFTDDFLNSDPE